MKTFKHKFFILTCLTVVASMTACLGSDDEPDIPYENLTPAEKKAAIQAIKGNYFGKVFFYNPYATTTSQIDSTEVNWTVTETDSMFHAISIPVSIFANYVDDMNHKNILQAGGNAAFRTTLHPNNIEKTNDGTYYLFSQYSSVYTCLFFPPKSGHVSPFVLGYTAVYLCGFIKRSVLLCKSVPLRWTRNCRS